MDSPGRKAYRTAILSFALLCALAAWLPLQAQTDTDGPLQPNTDVPRAHFIGNDTILRMHNAGLGDDVLLQTIQLQPGRYDTNPDDLIALKKEGLSDRVIAAMQAHTAGLGLHAVGGNAVITPSPLAPGIDEIGVYYQDKQGLWEPLKMERVQFKSGGWIKSTLTHGIIAKDLNGDIEGPHSPLVLPTGIEVLIYAPAGTEAEEYDFLRFRPHSTRREFRANTGGVFHSTTGTDRDDVEFHPVRIAAQMYTFTVPKDILKGEYGVLPPGSANPRGLIGNGKIYTFSIIE